jgi:hypothetical protein
MSVFTDGDDSTLESELVLVGDKEESITIWTDEVAAQGMSTAYETNTILTEPDLLKFYFKLDLPSSRVQDGYILYQYATLKKIDSTGD